MVVSIPQTVHLPERHKTSDTFLRVSLYASFDGQVPLQSVEDPGPAPPDPLRLTFAQETRCRTKALGCTRKVRYIEGYPSKSMYMQLDLKPSLQSENCWQDLAPDHPDRRSLFGMSTREHLLLRHVFKRASFIFEEFLDEDDFNMYKMSGVLGLLRRTITMMLGLILHGIGPALPANEHCRRKRHKVKIA